MTKNDVPMISYKKQRDLFKILYNLHLYYLTFYIPSM